MDETTEHEGRAVPALRASDVVPEQDVPAGAAAAAAVPPSSGRVVQLSMARQVNTPLQDRAGWSGGVCGRVASLLLQRNQFPGANCLPSTVLPARLSK
jgi:hypothetical protein